MAARCAPPGIPAAGSRLWPSAVRASPTSPGLARSERGSEPSGPASRCGIARPDDIPQPRGGAVMTTVLLILLTVLLVAAAAYVGLLLLRRFRPAAAPADDGSGTSPQTVGDLVRLRTAPPDDLSGDELFDAAAPKAGATVIPGTSAGTPGDD